MSVYSIDFTLPVNFTDHTGVTFENITTGEIVTPTTTFENSPSKLLSYTDVNWITPPVENDVVHYKYDGLGNYNDGPPDNNLMEAQTFNIVNCLDVPASAFSTVGYLSARRFNTYNTTQTMQAIASRVNQEFNTVRF